MCRFTSRFKRREQSLVLVDEEILKWLKVGTYEPGKRRKARKELKRITTENLQTEILDGRFFTKIKWLKAKVKGLKLL